MRNASKASDEAKGKFGQVLPITAAANPAITAVNPEIENPRTHRWNLAVEQQLGKDTSALSGANPRQIQFGLKLSF